MRGGHDALVRAARSLLVVITLSASMALVYLPTSPVAVNADTFESADPSATSAPSAEPPADPTPDPAATPEPTPEPPADPTATPGATSEPSPPPAATPGPSLEATPGPALDAPHVDIAHVTAGRVVHVGGAAAYLASDVPLLNEQRYQVFRLRFDVSNPGMLPVLWAPTLQVAQAGASFATLPAGRPATDLPFYVAPEWLRRPDGGTEIGPPSAVIPGAEGSVDGVRSMGINPLPVIELPPASRSIIEFSVRATADADYGATYDFRLTDAGVALPGAQQAIVTLEPRPAVVLTPGQRPGLPAGDAALRPTTRFQLNGAGPEPVHGPNYGLAADSCAACHRTHSAPAAMLNAAGPPELALCVTCHNGADAPDVAAAYATVPANNQDSRSYYQHAPSQVTGPLGTRNECSDCHNPHDSTSSASVTGPSGWSASGRIYGASGVAVTNGPGAPTYALVARSTLEYQLCFKCHSGYAQLPDNTDQPPSREALDKGVEFDPHNLSYHPVETAGTNDSDQMANSLAGTSPYKLWAFTPSSTIRCVNCHSDARLLALSIAGSGIPPADSSLPVHASPQRGILIANYLDRTLKAPLADYSAADFALCYLCHAEAPFRDTSGQDRCDPDAPEAPCDTNFRYHGLHVSGPSLQDHGSLGTDIDAPGDGGGLATCAECHFRIHSSAYPVGGQAPGTRLVDFAPNVTRTGGVPTWQAWSTLQPGSCTLKCHGQPHTATY